MTKTKHKLPEIEEGDFNETINHAIKEGRHKEYLIKVLDDYEKYKHVFHDAFIDKNPSNAIYTFRAKYLLKTPVWRDIVITGKQTFCDLADSIIDWMGWDNDHMHAFSMKKAAGEPQQRYTQFSMYSPGWEDDPYPTYKTNQIRIADIDFSKHPKWGFVFDFGDGHEFDITILKIDEKASVKDFDEPLPTCVDQRGVAPLQYPPLEDNEDWHFDKDCPSCQMLEKAGIKLISSPDDLEHNK